MIRIDSKVAYHALTIDNKAKPQVTKETTNELRNT